MYLAPISSNEVFMDVIGRFKSVICRITLPTYEIFIVRAVVSLPYSAADEMLIWRSYLVIHLSYHLLFVIIVVVSVAMRILPAIDVVDFVFRDAPFHATYCRLTC